MMIQDKPEIDSPTVRQIRIAFEQTPNKLRLVEQGWRERRREEIARKPVQHGTPRVEDVGHQARPMTTGTTARDTGRPTVAPTRIKPIMTPPTPPPTPPAESKPARTKADYEKDVAKDAPRRIISHPLPPMPTPMILGHKTTLFIPDQSPPCSYECVLRIGGRRISVVRGGDVVEVVSGNKVLKICRAEYKEWTQVERKQWETVWDLVEQVKRKTPRIKIYHPSALITITCSSLPDVIISFTMSVNSPKDRNLGLCSNRLVKVKLVYPPGENKLTIDTKQSSKAKHESTFRTRRCIPLPASHLYDIRSRKSMSLARDGLGIDIGDGWMKAEVEAVDRFWALREEWLR